MKRALLIVLSVFVAVCIFSSCSKSETQKTSTTQAQTTAKQSQYYDSKGNMYSSWLDVPFYDKDGNTYKLELAEDYMPDYVNQQSGERLNGLQCYIDENGCLYYDKDGKLSRKQNSMSVYYDESKKEYYDISTVTWDKDGTLHHEN